MPGPSQVTGELRIGPEGIYGIQLFGEGGLGKHGVELPVAGGAELYLWAESTATGTRHKVVRGEPQGFPQAELADWRFLTGFRQRAIRKMVLGRLTPPKTIFRICSQCLD